MSVGKISISGRASILAVAALAVLVLAGGLVLARNASAQGGGRRAMVFAPVLLNPPDLVRGGGDSILIGLLLPAVRQGSTSFRVQVTMGDGSVAVLGLPLVPGRDADGEIEVFLATDNSAQGFILHVMNRKTQEEATAHTMDTVVAVSILPAVQDGDAVQPLAGNLTISGMRDAVMGDGSVRLSIPITYVVQPPPDSARRG
ncbi:MAG: hypothetical protein ACHQ50_07410 [Fimbriimonadales bacterium]